MFPLIIATSLQLLLSLESGAGFGVTADRSEECWHSVDLNFAFFIDIISGPSRGELSVNVGLEVLALKLQVSSNNLIGCFLGILLGDPEMSGWETVLVLTFSGVSFVHGLHQSVIGFGLESIWGVSHVGFVSTESAHVSWEVHHMLLNISFIATVGIRGRIAVRRLRLGFTLRLGLALRFRLLLLLMEVVEMSLVISLDVVGFDVSGGNKAKEGSNCKIFHVIFIL